MDLQGKRWSSAFWMATIAATVAGTLPAAAQNLASNPGFEANTSPCASPGWVGIGTCAVTFEFVTGFLPHSGVNSAQIGNPNNGLGGISQSINVKPGKYDFSFWYQQYAGGPPATLTASIGSNSFTFGAVFGDPYKQFDQHVTLSGGTTQLTVQTAGSGLWAVALDDFSLIYLGPSPISPLLPSNAPVNAINVAGGIDNFINAGGNLPGLFANLGNLSGLQLVNALLQLDGETSTAAEKGAFQLMNQFLGVMLDPFVDGRFGAGTSSFAPDRAAALPPDIAMAYASVLKAPPMVVNNRWSVWGTGFGGSSHSNGDPTIGSNDVTANTYGFASGADYHFTRDSLVGFALAGAGTNWGLAQFMGSGRSDAFQAGVYGKTAWGPVYLAAAAAYTENWFRTNRVALGDQLTAKFNGDSYGGRLESGYRFILPSTAGQWEISPYAAIQAQSFHTGSFSETDLSGGGLGLNFNAMNATDTRSELGTRFADMTAVGGMPLILRARLAWAHDWVNNPALNAAFQALPGSSFTVNGAPIPSDSALASVGAELHMNTHWSASAKFDGEFARNSRTYAGTGTLRYTW